MTKGRKPKPAALKALQGNPGRRPIEPTLEAPVEAPECPDDLPEDAQAVWRETVAELIKLRVIATIDRETLGTYCDIVARAKRMRAFILKNGETYETIGKSGRMFRVRPELAILQDCEKQIRAFSAEWGMTAQGRARLHRDTGQGELPLDADPTAGY